MSTTNSVLLTTHIVELLAKNPASGITADNAGETLRQVHDAILYCLQGPVTIEGEISVHSAELGDASEADAGQAGSDDAASSRRQRRPATSLSDSVVYTDPDRWKSLSRLTVDKFHALIEEHKLPLDRDGFPIPQVPNGEIVQADFIYNPLDGTPHKMLKRTVRTQMDLSPEEFNALWNLPADTKLAAINYSSSKAESARANNLGKHRTRRAGAQDEVVAEEQAEAPKTRAKGRKASVEA
jgi:predicted transcriptional regulator